jgi:transcription termination/antitermination protein NusG
MTELSANGSNPVPREWWAVYTRHQHEKTVAENFSSSGLEVFLPLHSVVRQWKDRKKHLSLPLFPCYVFLRGESGRRVQVLSTPGVHSIVTIAGRPAAVPEVEIEAIRRAVESPLLVEPHPFLRRGDRVRIKSGPLADIEGILIRRKSSYRLILSAELLQKSIAVEVDAFSVEPLSRRAEVPPLPTIRSRPLVRQRAGEWQASARQRGLEEQLP